MGVTSSVTIVNYSTYSVQLQKADYADQLVPACTSCPASLPCSVITLSGQQLAVTEEMNRITESQQVVMREKAGNWYVLIFNADGGFSSEVKVDLLQHVCLDKVVNLSSRRHGRKATRYDARSIYTVDETLCDLVPSTGELSVKDGRICIRDSTVDLFFSLQNPQVCYCYLKDEGEIRLKTVRNDSSHPVTLSSRDTYRDETVQPNTFRQRPVYVESDHVKIEGQCLPFPVEGCTAAGGFLLSVSGNPGQLCGIIRDDPKWKLALSNSSGRKLTITLKSGKQKVVDSGVFVEYRDVAEVKTPDGTALGYLGMTAARAVLGGCLFLRSQEDSVTTRIDVKDAVGG